MARIAAIATAGVRHPWFDIDLDRHSDRPPRAPPRPVWHRAADAAASPTLTFTVWNPPPRVAGRCWPSRSGSAMLITRETAARRGRAHRAAARGESRRAGDEVVQRDVERGLGGGRALHPRVQGQQRRFPIARIAAKNADARSRRKVSAVPPQVSPGDVRVGCRLAPALAAIARADSHQDAEVSG